MLYCPVLQLTGAKGARRFRQLTGNDEICECPVAGAVVCVTQGLLWAEISLGTGFDKSAQ